MSFRHELARMRREYKKEAERLDLKIDSLSARTDRGFEIVSQRFQAMQDQLAAASEQIVEMRADHQELSRTLKGRARLLEDRFGKMLEALAMKPPHARNWKPWKPA